jgi:hypothetical protein
MFVFSLLVSNFDVPAPPADYPAATVRDEVLDELALSSAWLKLIHAPLAQPSMGIGSDQSDIDTPEFFFAATGRLDPQAELRATLDAMVQPATGDPNDHAQCRFPARFIWLKSVNLHDSKLGEVDCPAYKAWLGERPITGASLIFASGHLGNPSTFYGHMLLRLNSSSEEQPNRDQLLGKALNHGAVYPENENGIIYIFKGLSGGYSATFSELEFFTHEHRWNQDQLRDVWEYRLNLTSSQIELLAAHSWELKDTYTSYYFLRQNCAYRIAELVSVVLDEPLIPSDKPWTMPVDVLDSAQAINNRGAPLVSDVRLLPSRQSTFREKYRALEDADRSKVRNFIRERSGAVQETLATVDPANQAATLETLIDYFNMANAHTEAPEGAKAARIELLQARISMPTGSASEARASRLPPHEGNKSSLIQASLLENSELGSIVQLRFRGAYNDFLTRSPGSLPYSELSFADIKADLSESSLSVRSIEAIRITTLGLSETGLPDDRGLAWRFRFGGEQDRLDCKGCFVPYVEGGAGRAAYFNQDVVAYGLVTARLQGPEGDTGIGHLGALGGLITNPEKPLRASVEGGFWQDLMGDEQTRGFAQAEVRSGTSSNWDVSLSTRYERVHDQHTNEVRLGLSVYW